MDRDTIDVYEHRAAEWRVQREPADTRDAAGFGRAVEALDLPGAVVDLGCGPGWFTPHLGRPAVALDAAAAMLDLVPGYDPAALRVQADLAHLPLRRGGLKAAWASKSYLHLARSEVPMALHDLHRSLAVGGLARFRVAGSSVTDTDDIDHLEHGFFENDDFPGRRFSTWSAALLRAVLVGAGFTIGRFEVGETPEGHRWYTADTVRHRTLADTVGPDMRLLLCGLNPSVYSADVGAGFARPGNRFWPAALAAGVVTRTHDPVHVLQADRVGMTDLVKRASPRADDLTNAEYREGVARLELLVGWLQPSAVCFVGLAGWRAAVDRKAVAGPQARLLGGRPVYVMPNTSGINASSSLADLTEHLRGAAALADDTTGP